ncbi:MAG: 3-phosphoglycerate dehydrogenase [Candidatus Cloacimonetes bacterium]|jgi:D-3-phosphoglycerate dehydrogenase|nr:3-phosphoglycerate dehydrogenase [Candidatus Cloacimonadota bacterium]MDD2506218.1 3-phosphoglycerate dehydrogenase [Candidatus Cloacimonadota bacterium]MDD4559619.1 3-phosphoglycerate dehydrogenase [Candidatus Cloacimonadota bacterium]
MPKVLIATEKPFAAEAAAKIKAELESAKYDYSFLESYTDVKDFHNAVADAEALIIRSDKVDEAVFNAAKKLKIVVRAGAGYDNVDLKAATAHDVVVMNTPGQNSNAVAELAIGMMIYMARGKFNGKTGTEIAGKKLVLFGFGYIARLVAKMARGIGMIVYAYDPYIADEVMVKESVKPLKKVEDIFKTGDYVSIHIPANSETKKSINWEMLSLMPDGATLVNTARKEVIDEEGLLQAFAQKKGFRYVSDVAPDNLAAINEQYADRIYCTPKKMGAQTAEANTNAGIAAAKQIVAFFEKGDKTFKVN